MTRKPSRKPGIALLAVADNLGEAQVWESVLRAAGIPCLVRNVNPMAYLLGPLPYDQATYEVYVPATARQRAEEILAPSLNAESAQRVTVHSRVAAWMWLVGILGGLTIVVAGYLGLR